MLNITFSFNNQRGNIHYWYDKLICKYRHHYIPSEINKKKEQKTILFIEINLIKYLLGYRHKAFFSKNYMIKKNNNKIPYIKYKVFGSEQLWKE